MSNALLVALLWTIVCLPAVARDGVVNAMERGQAPLARQQGSIALFNGVAKLELPPSLRYISPDDAELLPLGAAKSGPDSKQMGIKTGVIAPLDLGSTGGRQWAIFVRYDQHGHVEDGEVDGIDFEKLLNDLQISYLLSNRARIASHYPAVGKLAWAELPYYDKSKHSLYWGQEIEFLGMVEHTLNMEARLLGRVGVLKFEAVSDMQDLAVLKDAMQQVLKAIEFTEGHRYVDFLARSDQRADYGIAALISGAEMPSPAGPRGTLTSFWGFKSAICLLLLIAGSVYVLGGPSRMRR